MPLWWILPFHLNKILSVRFTTTVSGGKSEKPYVELIDDKTGLTELGAKNSVKLKDIASYFESKSDFEGKIDDQIPEGYTDGPDANDVYEYAKKEL